MDDQRAGNQQTGGDAGAPAPGQPARRYGASRVRPRIEVSRQPPPPAQPLTPEVLEPDQPWSDAGPTPSAPSGAPSGDPFAPREFAGGRVRVYGCSPGCLIASLVVSIILTLLLNAIL